MPIYEFYCPDCHTLFNFLSRRAGSRKRPACPRCSRPRLQKRPSRFAISSGRGEREPEETGLPDLDEGRLEGALQSLAGEMESVGDDDPRAMSRMMRKFYDGTGLRMGEGMQEALRRMEAGEDPDKIEEEMGELLEREDALFATDSAGLSALGRKLRPPSVDRELYEL